MSPLCAEWLEVGDDCGRVQIHWVIGRATGVVREETRLPRGPRAFTASILGIARVRNSGNSFRSRSDCHSFIGNFQFVGQICRCITVCSCTAHNKQLHFVRPRWRRETIAIFQHYPGGYLSLRFSHALRLWSLACSRSITDLHDLAGLSRHHGFASVVGEITNG